MAFIKDTTNTNFSTSRVHGVLRLETNPAGNLVAVVNSYATDQAFAAQRLNWQDTHEIPTYAAVNPEAWLIGPEGPFAGAVLLVEDTPIEKARSAKWGEIKATRDRLEASGFPFLGKVIQSDAASMRRITLAGQEAQAAILLNTAFTREWVCLDNSTLTLDARDMLALVASMSGWSNGLASHAAELRERIDAAATPEEVAAITW